MTVTYLGIKGTRGVQQFLPANLSNRGNGSLPPLSHRLRVSNLGRRLDSRSRSIQLRRRLRAGFTANLQYTYSKSIDDDATLGGQGPVPAGGVAPTVPAATIAQNWLNLRAERGLSTFDQRNLLNAQIQYTTGMGIGGGTLLGGWRGKLLKEWTAAATITAGSGLPQTPIYLAAVQRHGRHGQPSS